MRAGLSVLHVWLCASEERFVIRASLLGTILLVCRSHERIMPMFDALGTWTARRSLPVDRWGVPRQRRLVSAYLAYPVDSTEQLRSYRNAFSNPAREQRCLSRRAVQKTWFGNWPPTRIVRRDCVCCAATPTALALPITHSSWLSQQRPQAAGSIPAAETVNFALQPDAVQPRRRLADHGIPIVVMARAGTTSALKCSDPDGYVVEAAWEPERRVPVKDT